MISAAVIRFCGGVQGVGFRPHVYRIAQAMDIKGWINNTSQGVTIHAEGVDPQGFYQCLVNQPPPLARVTKHSYTIIEPMGYRDFVITESIEQNRREVLISPDIATCDECVAEIKDTGSRRFHYPFTNCTNCGPRYTIIYDIPYDRPHTTMADFPMCPECLREYSDPANRRFHAQPIACPVCGPRVVLQDQRGMILQGMGLEELKSGAILAVKGLGGFHLACNALDRRAVSRLRQRKLRESKPFAVMARDLAVIRRYCELNQREVELLTSSAAPIVVLKNKGDLVDLGLPAELAPGLNTLGVMLPYAPLHHLLLSGEIELLVMTSANRSGEPLITENEQALGTLKGVADYWLHNNRDICHPCDDSVIRVINDKAVFYRRARGYVPFPQELANQYPPVLGVGGDMKNTFCVLKGDKAFVSQHGGDLQNYDNYLRFTREVESFKQLVDVEPACLAFDLHPGYKSTRYAKGLSKPGVGVQHHHAHLAACLAEHGIKEKVLGVICDGTGFGLDDKIWGFEFLWGDTREFQRVGHLEYLPLPGGDCSSRKPVRIAAAYLIHLFGAEGRQFFKYLSSISEEELAVLYHQVERGLNTFATSSCGRLFDAVSALIGVCCVVNYEGQAAIELESVIDETEPGSYDFAIETAGLEHILRVKPLMTGILTDLTRGLNPATIAAKFHNTVAVMICETVKKLSLHHATLYIALSGGVFQNKYLVEQLIPRLEGMGFKVLQHLNPGDGSLCIGQAIVASEVIANVSGNTDTGPEYL